MKALLTHLAHENLDEIVEKSLLDCHARGVHSIMFLDSPGKSIRMFYASEQHTLDSNDPSRAGPPMSIAIHPHRRNIMLATLMGTLYNYRFVDQASPHALPLPLQRYRYQSKIKDGEAGFTLEATCILNSVGVDVLEADKAQMMSSKELHTVRVKAGERCAWLVLEGRADPDYQNICYSNANLAGERLEGMYRKPTRSQVLDILTAIGI